MPVYCWRRGEGLIRQSWTPSSASLATPAVASIAVSNSDAVQQGTADGNAYQYAAQCVPGSALTCVTDGVWTTPALYCPDN